MLKVLHFSASPFTASSNGESAPKHQNKQHIKSQIITYFCADSTHILVVPIGSTWNSTQFFQDYI